MIIKESLINYFCQRDSSNFFNHSSRESDIDIIYGNIINSYMEDDETEILEIESDEYGRIGYYKSDVLYVNGNLTGSRGRFYLIVDENQMKKKFKDGLYTVYGNGNIINNLIDDPDKNVFKKKLFKHDTIYIEEVKYDISIFDIALLTDEHMILKNNNIIQYRKYPETIIFNTVDCIEYDKDQTYDTLPEIYIPKSVFIEISKSIDNNNSKIPYFRSKEFIKYDNFILMVPNEYDIIDFPSTSYVIQNGHIIPVAIGLARIIYNDYEHELLENIEKDLKKQIKRMKIHPNIKKLSLSNKEKKLIRKTINNIYKNRINDILDNINNQRYCDGNYSVKFFI